eukprot:4785579-Pleurochrysis_carterae.AAC.2
MRACVPTCTLFEDRTDHPHVNGSPTISLHSRAAVQERLLQSLFESFAIGAVYCSAPPVCYQFAPLAAFGHWHG